MGPGELILTSRPITSIIGNATTATASETLKSRRRFSSRGIGSASTSRSYNSENLPIERVWAEWFKLCGNAPGAYKRCGNAAANNSSFASIPRAGIDRTTHDCPVNALSRGNLDCILRRAQIPVRVHVGINPLGFDLIDETQRSQATFAVGGNRSVDFRRLFSRTENDHRLSPSIRASNEPSCDRAEQRDANQSNRCDNTPQRNERMRLRSRNRHAGTDHRQAHHRDSAATMQYGCRMQTDPGVKSGHPFGDKDGSHDQSRCRRYRAAKTEQNPNQPHRHNTDTSATINGKLVISWRSNVLGPIDNRWTGAEPVAEFATDESKPDSGRSTGIGSTFSINVPRLVYVGSSRWEAPWRPFSHACPIGLRVREPYRGFDKAIDSSGRFRCRNRRWWLGGPRSSRLATR